MSFMLTIGVDPFRTFEQHVQPKFYAFTKFIVSCTPDYKGEAISKISQPISYTSIETVRWTDETGVREITTDFYGNELLIARASDVAIMLINNNGYSHIDKATIAYLHSLDWETRVVLHWS